MKQKRKFRGRVAAYLETLRSVSRDQKIGGRVLAINRGARYVSLSVRLTNPLDLDRALKLSGPLALSGYARMVIVARDGGTINYHFELPSHFWRVYTRDDVTGLGIGLSERARQVDFAFDPPHSLIGGTTKCGKTETTKSILVGLATEYSPDDLSIAIVDLKRDYQAFDNLAHLSLPIARTDDEISQAISWGDQELKHRMELGQQYRHRRLVFVLDEAEHVLTSDRRGRARLDSVQRIAKMGQALNMHLIVSTQEPQKGLVKEFKSQLLNRWIGLVESAQASYYLSGHAGLDCHLLTGNGDFIHVAGSTQERLQVAMPTRADYDRLPRAEVREPDFEPVDYDIEALGGDVGGNGSEGRGPGRPSLELDPEAVAFYLWFQDKISISRAGELLGLSKRAHYLNRDFARKVAETIIRIRREKITV